MSLRKNVKEINSKTPGGSEVGRGSASWGELRGALTVLKEHLDPGYAKRWVNGGRLFQPGGKQELHDKFCKMVPWWPAEYLRQSGTPLDTSETYNRVHKCHWEPRKSVNPATGYRGGVRTLSSWEHVDKHEGLKRCKGTIETLVSRFLNDETKCISKEEWDLEIAKCHARTPTH